MRTLEPIRPRQKYWRLVILCAGTLLAALAATIADAAPSVHATRDFWVWDLRVMPPAFRKATATLRATGERSLVYVEDKLWGENIRPEFLDRLKYHLEIAAPSAAYDSDKGVVALEEDLFGSLPRKVTADPRLIVLFAELGQYKDKQFDGFFNAFDQLTEKEAFSQYQQHSNEANIIYMNGFRQSESYTTGVIAHELQHLLASSHQGAERESWLSETLAEGAMLLAGFFTDQSHVNRFVADPGKHPLVSPSYVQYGPQLLFASYLIDSLSFDPGITMTRLNSLEAPGRDAVEKLVFELSGEMLPFDAIFSKFVTYVFEHSETGASLPISWRHSPGIMVPKIIPEYVFPGSSGEMRGALAPYSFAAIDLKNELSPDARIEVQRETPPGATPGSCAASGSVLWKPVNRTRIAVYSVGCDPDTRGELLRFRLKIQDRPSLPGAQPFKLP